jgi:hypothetical protein
VAKAIKEMRDKTATGEYDVPGDVLLGENGLRLMTCLINIYENGKWLKGFNEFTMNILKKQPKATKKRQPLQNQPQRTYSKDSSRTL